MTVKTAPSRRKFLKTALAGAGAAAAVPMSVKADEYITPSMTTPGKAFTPYGMPSGHEEVKRLLRPPGISPGTGGSLSPLESLEGMITPSGLHFERHHNGVPDIDPKTHKFLLHGLVNKPLEFSMDALMRYPRVSRMHFVECGGNSGANAGAPEPPQLTAGGIHGLVSCSEWTGIQLGLLLDEAGVQPDGKWILAESADAASLSRSVPLKEAHEQGILALYQNGERLRPEQGYPLRLLMPGWEGNLNVKWLHRIKVTNGPTMTKDETSKYTQSQKDGKAKQFNFIQPVKSVITRPCGTMTMNGPGYYEISGIAWSGHGKIAKVEISMDGGKSWTDAEMPGPVLPKCLSRFRLPWEWDGKPVLLQSRSTDEAGNVQPTRAVWKAAVSSVQFYQYNAIQTWQIGADNTVKSYYVKTIAFLLAAAAPHFGAPADPALLKAWDVSIPPDGAGLPPGHGSVSEGLAIYTQKCVMRHGVNGVGKPADQLTGGVGSLASPNPVKTVSSYWPYATTLFDYIRRAMPITSPHSQTDHETYALVAYILSIDGIVKKDAVMDAKSLPKVKMPNRDGFIDAYGATKR